jgi:hypothetical protein
MKGAGTPGAMSDFSGKAVSMAGTATGTGTKLVIDGGFRLV